MVRLAEGLDRSHAQAVFGLKVVPDGKRWRVSLRTRGDIELEVWAAHRHAAELAGLLGADIHFDVERVSAGAARRPSGAPRRPKRARRRVARNLHA